MSDLDIGVALRTPDFNNTESFPVSVLCRDGKVIISTLPDGPATGAELFKILHPLERERFAFDLEKIQHKRLFFRWKNNGFMLYTGMCFSHGIILAVKINAPISEAFSDVAQCHGFEELKTLNRNEPLAQIRQAAEKENDICSAAVPFLFMRELGRLFYDSSEASFGTECEAEELLNKFSRFSNVRARVYYSGISDTCVLQGVDGKMLGIVTVIASAMANILSEDKCISVTFSERSKRLWVKIELAANIKRKRASAIEKIDFEELELFCRDMWGLKCKNFHIAHDGTSVVISYSPTVFDPTAEGLMQRRSVGRQCEEKGLR